MSFNVLSVSRINFSLSFPLTLIVYSSSAVPGCFDLAVRGGDDCPSIVGASSSPPSRGAPLLRVTA